MNNEYINEIVSLAVKKGRNLTKMGEAINDLMEITPDVEERKKFIIYIYSQMQNPNMGRYEMHAHTTMSDGKWTPEQYLLVAYILGVDHVSITDHDAVDAYLSNDVYKIVAKYDLNLVPGCEFVCMSGNVPIEILGYGIDVGKASEYLKVNGITQQKLEMFRFEHIPAVFKRHGIDLHYDMSKIDLNAKDPQVLPTMLEAIKNDPKARALVESENPELLTDINIFLRSGLNNPKSMFYMDTTKKYPSYDSICRLIHDLGGIASLAHPYQYKNNMMNVLDTVTSGEENSRVDGIECIHFTTMYADRRLGQDPKKVGVLVDYADKKRLLKTGGSDAHRYEAYIEGSKPNDKSLFGAVGVPELYYQSIYKYLEKRLFERER